MSPLDRRNNLTLARNCCALAVCVGHYFYLAAPSTGEDLNSFPWANLGVQAFFVISGFLVTLSYMQSENVASFFTRRAFRLYPLYLTTITLQALVLVILLVSAGRPYSTDLARYLGWNAIFLNFMAPDMGGVLHDLPVQAINPSLWTLKIEVLFYLCVPLLHLGFRRFGFWFLTALFCGSTVFASTLAAEYPNLARQLPGQMRYFAVGMAMAYGWTYIAAAPKVAAPIVTLVLIGALALSIRVSGDDYGLQPLLVGAVVLGFGFWLPALPQLPDMSYGIYLFHAPLIQVSLALGVYQGGALGLASTLALVIGAALLASRYIEGPFIRLGKRLAADARRGSFSSPQAVNRAAATMPDPQR